MFIDLNVPVPVPLSLPSQPSKKGKGKQSAQVQAPAVVFSPAQISALEARIDLLHYLGYTIVAFNQLVHKRVDPKIHVNILDPLLSQLRKREDIVYLKRLTIVLDEDSEKGFGLAPGSTTLFSPYDLLSLLPTTPTTLSLACLTHTVPSPLTTHIISLPLSLPRLPFPFKHTLIRTALKHGCVFEIPYAAALGGEGEASAAMVGGAESGSALKRCWWAAAREVVRVTKGKGIIVTGGALNQSDLRAPRDISNLITMLDLPQNLAHDTITKTPQSLILRSQTRRTYRAIFSEPQIVWPKAPPADQLRSFPAEPVTQQPHTAQEEEMVDVIPPGSGTSITTGTNDRKRTRDTGDKKTSSVQDHEESVKFFIRDIDNVEDMGGGGSSLTEAGSRKKKKKEKGGKSSSKAD